MLSKERSTIKRTTFNGEFWKPCPGTGAGYLCCGYQILTPMQGCGMHCRYCILHAYLEQQCQTVFENYQDLESEVHRKMKLWHGVVRFGTGEFADSLFAEDNLGLSRKIAATLKPYGNVVVEFKTKSTAVGSLGVIRNPRRVIVGFSLNTPRMIGLFEKGTASLEERLEAARRCEEMGFHVAFHFDPMFWYEGWEEEYREVVRMIYSSVADFRNIAWVSLGGFRSVPSLKKKLREEGDHLPLFSGEMVAGSDGKLRYFRPYRVALYRAMREEFEFHDPSVTLYLCMENRDTWEDAGMMGRIPEGLKRYLDRRAEEMLASGIRPY